jgi:hypothetical protein
MFVRIGSHRAGDRLERALGRGLEWFYTNETGGCLVRIDAAELPAARRVPSVTLARLKSEPRKCWDMGRHGA